MHREVMAKVETTNKISYRETVNGEEGNGQSLGVLHLRGE